MMQEIRECRARGIETAGPWKERMDRLRAHDVRTGVPPSPRPGTLRGPQDTRGANESWPRDQISGDPMVHPDVLGGPSGCDPSNEEEPGSRRAPTPRETTAGETPSPDAVSDATSPGGPVTAAQEQRPESRISEFGLDRSQWAGAPGRSTMAVEDWAVACSCGRRGMLVRNNNGAVKEAAAVVPVFTRAPDASPVSVEPPKPERHPPPKAPGPGIPFPPSPDG